MIRILDYRAEHQPFFDSLNREWIERLFFMEPLDEWVLTNPDKAILEKGGAILMAEYDGVITGTVALRKLNEETFEFTKMAVDKNFRRKGIAEAISYASFLKAKELGAKKIVLYSNRKNIGAPQLYEKISFKHVEVENDVYARANIKMEIGIEEAILSARKYYELLDNSNIETRRAKPEEAEIISSLIYQAFEEYKPLYTQKGFDATTPGHEEIENRIRNRTVWVAVYKNKIAGTVSCILCDENLYVRSMAVSKTVRRKGLGKALMRQMEKVAGENKCKNIELTITPFLKSAIHLYGSFGFVENGYKDLFGTPLIKMIKNIEPVSETKIEKNVYNE
jgi:ribosomal protein S18 acetylase RimI-like enzyme